MSNVTKYKICFHYAQKLKNEITNLDLMGANVGILNYNTTAKQAFEKIKKELDEKCKSKENKLILYLYKNRLLKYHSKDLYECLNEIIKLYFKNNDTFDQMYNDVFNMKTVFLSYTNRIKLFNLYTQFINHGDKKIKEFHRAIFNIISENKGENVVFYDYENIEWTSEVQGKIEDECKKCFAMIQIIPFDSLKLTQTPNWMFHEFKTFYNEKAKEEIEKTGNKSDINIKQKLLSDLNFGTILSTRLNAEEAESMSYFSTNLPEEIEEDYKIWCDFILAKEQLIIVKERKHLLIEKFITTLTAQINKLEEKKENYIYTKYNPNL